MSEISAETFAQRAFDANLLDAQQIETVWSEIGTRSISASQFHRVLVRKELLTNWQVERLLAGERHGFFWGSYKVLYLVGAGTFARVYRSAHRESAEVAAVKVLRQRYCDNPEKKEEFNHEAEMVMKLRHRNIVPIYEVGEERSRNYMVMEFVEGHNLREFLKIRKKFSVLESLNLVADVTHGLDYALQRGITHRDLKLSNVLVSSQGVAKLVDFGLAALAELKTDTGHSARSIDYAGLERASGVRRDDPRSDIFFTGCMLYHLITGQSPLVETKERIKRLDVSRYRDIKPIAAWEPSLPRFVIQLVSRAMDAKAERRYATPAEMLRDVESAIERVKAGETESVIAPEPTDAGETAETALPHDADLRTVMLVESNVETQNVLRTRLKRRGYRVLVISDPQRALDRFLPSDPAAECVVFCASELDEAAVDAFNGFAAAEHTRDIPAILLLDEHQQSLSGRAELAEHRVCMQMPIKLSQLLAALRRLLAASAEKR